jgi:hypothetical protein
MTMAGRVWNARTEVPPEGAVWVDRKTPWGNPFKIGVHGTREECYELYEAWILDPKRAVLRAQIRQHLRDKDLICWCYPKLCHGIILADIAFEDPPNK